MALSHSKSHCNDKPNGGDAVQRLFFLHTNVWSIDRLKCSNGMRQSRLEDALSQLHATLTVPIRNWNSKIWDTGKTIEISDTNVITTYTLCAEAVFIHFCFLVMRPLANWRTRLLVCTLFLFAINCWSLAYHHLPPFLHSIRPFFIDPQPFRITFRAFSVIMRYSSSIASIDRLNSISRFLLI